MKLSLLKRIAFLLIVAGTFAFCQKPPEPDPNPEEPINYPIEIPFTELQTQCQWKNLEYDNVIIINSNAELGKYITCMGGSSYPAIDFSTQTLLLVGGKANLGICNSTATGLQQLSSDKYELNVEIALNDASDMEEWATAVIVKKMKEENHVELKTTIEVTETKIILPVVVTDQKIIDFFRQCRFTGGRIDPPSSCFFTTLPPNQDACLMINTMDEFRNVYECTDDLPEIDFDNYTLIIGKKQASSGGWSISTPRIIENCDLTFSIEFVIGNGPQIMGILCYWRLYPKLPNKPFYVEYKYREI